MAGLVGRSGVVLGLRLPLTPRLFTGQVHPARPGHRRLQTQSPDNTIRRRPVGPGCRLTWAAARRQSEVSQRTLVSSGTGDGQLAASTTTTASSTSASTNSTNNTKNQRTDRPSASAAQYRRLCRSFGGSGSPSIESCSRDSPIRPPFSPGFAVIFCPVTEISRGHRIRAKTTTPPHHPAPRSPNPSEVDHPTAPPRPQPAPPQGELEPALPAGLSPQQRRGAENSKLRWRSSYMFFQPKQCTECLLMAVHCTDSNGIDEREMKNWCG